MGAGFVSGQADHRRWWALSGLSLAVLAVSLDATVLSVALPTLATSLHASTSDLQWFVSAYTLALAVALLPGGLLGDRFGRKKLMLLALAMFGVGSLACASASGPSQFTAARAFLGLSAGFMIPLVISVVAVLFTDAELPKALAVWGAATFLGLPLGPILGGWILAHHWWGWVFLMNLPVVAIGLVAVAALVPESRASTPPGLDPVGIVTSCAGLAILIYGFISAGQDGWGSSAAIVGIVAGAALVAAFVAWERHLSNRPGGQPLMDLDLFRSQRFTWGTILQAFGVFAMFGLLFALPQFLQVIRGVDAMGSGLRLLPLLIGLALGAGLANVGVKRFTAKATATAGFVVLAAGLLLGTTMTVSSDDRAVAVWTGLAGLGFGLVLATAATAALVDIPTERAGVGSAVMQAVQKAGAPLSAAVLGSVLASGYRSHLDVTGLPSGIATAVRDSVYAGVAAASRTGSAALMASVRSAFVHGLGLMLWVSVGVALLGAILSLFFLPRHVTTTAVPPEDEAGASGELPHERVART